MAWPWGDLSQNVHALLGIFAKSTAEANAQSKGGREGAAGAGELGKIMGDVRRAMPVQVVGSQELCLFEKTISTRARGKGSKG